MVCSRFWARRRSTTIRERMPARRRQAVTGRRRLTARTRPKRRRAPPFAVRPGRWLPSTVRRWTVRRRRALAWTTIKLKVIVRRTAFDQCRGYAPERRAAVPWTTARSSGRPLPATSSNLVNNSRVGGGARVVGRSRLADSRLVRAYYYLRSRSAGRGHRRRPARCAATIRARPERRCTAWRMSTAAAAGPEPDRSTACGSATNTTGRRPNAKNTTSSGPKLKNRRRVSGMKSVYRKTRALLFETFPPAPALLFG